jgi:hypothetical protein
VGDGRRETERELGRGVGARIECLSLGVKDGRGAGEARCKAGIPAARRLEQRKGRGHGRKEKEAPTGGANVSVTVGKRKRRRGTRAGAGEDVGPVGRCGLKGKEVRFSLFFLFPTQLKPTF